MLVDQILYFTFTILLLFGIDLNNWFDYRLDEHPDDKHWLHSHPSINHVIYQ